MTIMPKKNLTADEITELRNCPFVASVISGRVKFTPEFRRMAYQQLTSGKSVREIFEENGRETHMSILLHDSISFCTIPNIGGRYSKENLLSLNTFHL